MNDWRKIEVGLGIIAFIVGFIFLSLVSFFSNNRSVDINDMGSISELQSMFGSESQFVHTVGLWSLLGFALISIGVIIIVMVKTKKVIIV